MNKMLKKHITFILIFLGLALSIKGLHLAFPINKSGLVRTINPTPVTSPEFEKVANDQIKKAPIF